MIVLESSNREESKIGWFVYVLKNQVNSENYKHGCEHLNNLEMCPEIQIKFLDIFFSRVSVWNESKPVYKKQNSTHCLAHAHELRITFLNTPFTTTIKTAWKLLRDYKDDDTSTSPQLPSQMCVKTSADKRMWTEGDIKCEPHVGIKS